MLIETQREEGVEIITLLDPIHDRDYLKLLNVGGEGYVYQTYT